MARKTYWQKLKDPRWQKKRLEVLEAAGWECRNCGATDKTLNVRHTFYRRNADPWDYPDWALLVLCEDCHLLSQQLMEKVNIATGKLADGPGLARVLGYAEGLMCEEWVALGIEEERFFEAYSYEWCLGFADALRLTPDEVIDAACERTITSVDIDKILTARGR